MKEHLFSYVHWLNIPFFDILKMLFTLPLLIKNKNKSFDSWLSELRFFPIMIWDIICKQISEVTIRDKTTFLLHSILQQWLKKGPWSWLQNQFQRLHEFYPKQEIYRLDDPSPWRERLLETLLMTLAGSRTSSKTLD